ncbi:MAG: TonB-dependent receptor [Pseudomonadota bacterium]
MKIFSQTAWSNAGLGRQLAPVLVASTLALAVMPVVAAESAPSNVEEIQVFGKGETRQIQTLTAAQLGQFPAGTSPLKAIEKLPGVNFQSADPYGSYEWSTRIVVRGFGQNQMGFTLDGIPLGDMTYGNHNGLHISRAIMSENIGSTSLAQGAGALSTASTSNLGGTLAFTSSDAAQEFGVQANGSVGSDEARRAYIRLDSGDLGAGVRGFVSYADQSTEKWKGAGEQAQEYFNGKLVAPIGEGQLTGYYAYSDRAEIDYQDMSLEMIRRLGRDSDNFYPDYARAIATAQGNFSGGMNSLDDAYWNASGLREDNLGYVKLDLPLNDDVALDATWYQHTNEGQGLWGTPYLATPGGAPLSIRTTEYDIDRYGVVSSLTFDMASHSFNAGFWYEDNDFNQARRFYGEPSSIAPSRDFTDFQRNPFLTQWEYAFNTETLQFHVQDTWQVTDQLRIQYGFKSVNVEVSANTITGANKTGSLETDEGFLPQASFVYALNDTNEMFGAVTRNVRAMIASGTSGAFSASQAGFDAIKNTLKPEMATTFELGWRLDTDELQGVVSVYYVDFEDRLLSIQQGSSIIGNFNALANVGSVSSTGIEAGVNLKLNDWMTWYNSASYNRSTYEDDFRDGTTLVPVAGKTVVDAPEWLVNTELNMEIDRAFAKIGYKYTGERYYTYLNQGGVDGFGVANLSLGYKLLDIGGLKQLTAQLDLTNAFDEDYISTVGSGGFTNADPAGTAQTLLPGAPRQVFLSLKAAF